MYRTRGDLLHISAFRQTVTYRQLKITRVLYVDRENVMLYISPPTAIFFRTAPIKIVFHLFVSLSERHTPALID